MPLWIAAHLPKKRKATFIASKWDSKTDGEVLEAFTSDSEWIEISQGIFKSETTLKIAARARERLDAYILPQMEKRGLT